MSVTCSGEAAARDSPPLAPPRRSALQSASTLSLSGFHFGGHRTMGKFLKVRRRPRFLQRPFLLSGLQSGIVTFSGATCHHFSSEQSRQRCWGSPGRLRASMLCSRVPSFSLLLFGSRDGCFCSQYENIDAFASGVEALTHPVLSPAT